MKYVYIVTRMVTGNSPGTVDIPNLGVHSNQKAAEKHYNSIILDRDSLGCYIKQLGSANCPGERRNILREARIDYSTAKYDRNKIENLQLERWSLK